MIDPIRQRQLLFNAVRQRLKSCRTVLRTTEPERGTFPASSNILSIITHLCQNSPVPFQK